MRDYSKLPPAWWTAGGKALRGKPIAQLVALYLFSAPQSTMTGIYYLPLVTLCHEVGLSQEDAHRALELLSAADVAHYDEAAELVWVPEMATREMGPALSPGDNRIKGTAKALVVLGGHRFVDAFLARYGKAYNLPFEAPSEPLARPFEAPSEPLRSQDQDQDQDPSGGSAADAPPAPAPAADSKAAEGVQLPLLVASAPTKRTKKPAKDPAAKAANALGWRTWRAAYLAHYGKQYSNADACGPAMVSAVKLAEEMLVELQRPPGDLEELLAHRWRKYLADPGGSKTGGPGFLREHHHPLRHFQSGVQEYGTPWDCATGASAPEARPRVLIIAPPPFPGLKPAPPETASSPRPRFAPRPDKRAANGGPW